MWIQIKIVTHVTRYNKIKIMELNAIPKINTNPKKSDSFSKLGRISTNN